MVLGNDLRHTFANKRANMRQPASSAVSPQPHAQPARRAIQQRSLQTSSGSCHFSALATSCVIPKVTALHYGPAQMSLYKPVLRKEACLCCLIGHQGRRTRGGCRSESGEASLLSGQGRCYYRESRAFLYGLQIDGV